MLMCTRVQAAAACACNYTYMRVHSVQCNVNLVSTCEGLQLTLVSAWEYTACIFELGVFLNLWLHGTNYRATKPHIVNIYKWYFKVVTPIFGHTIL